MATRFSTGLKNIILELGAFKQVMDDSVLRIYSGPVPADADAALGAAVLLNEYTDAGQVLAPGTGLDFDTTAAFGALGKDPAQSWEGDAVGAGDATFYRLVTQVDTGVLSDVEPRIQGTVGGVGADMFVQSVTFVISTTYTIDYYSVAIPDL